MAAYSPRGALPLSTEACLLRPLPVLQGAGAAGLRAWGKAPACRASESPAESSMGAGAQRAIRALLVLGGTCQASVSPSQGRVSLAIAPLRVEGGEGLEIFRSIDTAFPQHY